MHALALIIGGQIGTGKTSQLITLARLFLPVRWAYTEKKDEGDLNAIPELKSTLIHARDKQFNDDPVKMITEFEKWRDSVIDEINNDVEINCIVVDGISGLRKYAYEEWLENHPVYDKKTGEKRKREGIAEGNIRAWHDINTRVWSLINPLINIAYYCDCHLFMTALTKGIYINNKYKYEEADVKDWIKAPCNCLFMFTKEKRAEKYECSCEKAPLWSGGSGWVEELHKDTGLLEVLSKHNLI